MLYATLAASTLFLVSRLSTAHGRPHSFSFNFTTVRECEPVSLTFPDVGTDEVAVPTRLTLLPVNATPTVIDLPNVADNFLEGINVNFLPLAEGTQFIASLDDDNGDAVAYVTEVLTVQSSNSSDGDCVPAAVDPVYTFDTAVTQCGDYSVSYNSSTEAPTLRVASMSYTTYALNETSSTDEMATFIAAIPQGAQVVFIANNSLGQAQTSPLLTVLGDSTIDPSCLPSITTGGESDGESEDTEPEPSLSRGAIIGLAVGGVIIVLVAILMVIYFVRERRLRQKPETRRRAQSVLDASGFYERPNASDLNSSTANLTRNMTQRSQGRAISTSTARPSMPPTPDTAPRESYIPYVLPPMPPTPPEESPASPNSPMKVYPVKHNSEFLTGNEAFVMNPSYAYNSPPASPHPSIGSEFRMAPPLPRSPLATEHAPSPTPSTLRRNSMHSLDIETMLNMASSLPEERVSQDDSDSQLAVVRPSPPPAPATRTPPAPRREHNRAPSDVPRDPYASGLSAFDFANSRPPSFASLASRRLQQHQRTPSSVSRGDSVLDAGMLLPPRAF
ncbi:hypothetical protein BD626DRAFT_568732 [Schizophyllum amplum]|uniref:Mid2 domain-containing protein n=1 Tax=Schizophyllum amplum TaxID=97359 RepID=A0A550CH62_9AGAR|nr:hypothetical protein BD626DRAFT_568732 [Auriculariopsis ampla]